MSAIEEPGVRPPGASLRLVSDAPISADDEPTGANPTAQGVPLRERGASGASWGQVLVNGRPLNEG